MPWWRISTSTAPTGGALYGSARFYEHLGFHRVYDSVSVDLRLELGPQAEEEPELEHNPVVEAEDDPEP